MKYFVTSDIHGFYDELIKGLDKAGFDYNDENHVLIICGDIFDRGPKPKEVMDFIRSLPKKRRILIRGNHEYLFKDLVYKYKPEEYDFLNGTVETVNRLLDIKGYSRWINSEDYFNVLRPIIEWFESDEWLDYYELNDYIFVHSFLPLRDGKLLDNWRNINYSKEELIDATWFSPYDLFDEGLFSLEAQKGKILVCGHYFARLFHEHYEGITGNDDIYYSKHLIGLDACSVRSHKVNILVIEDDLGDQR